MLLLLLFALVSAAPPYETKQITNTRVDIVTPLYPDIESCHCYTNCSATLSRDHRSIYISNGNWTRLVVKATFRHPDGRSDAAAGFDILRQEESVAIGVEPVVTPLERRWYTIMIFAFAGCATLLAIWWQLSTPKKDGNDEYVTSKRRDKALAAADLDMY